MTLRPSLLLSTMLGLTCLTPRAAVAAAPELPPTPPLVSSPVEMDSQIADAAAMVRKHCGVLPVAHVYLVPNVKVPTAAEKKDNLLADEERNVARFVAHRMWLNFPGSPPPDEAARQLEAAAGSAVPVDLSSGDAALRTAQKLDPDALKRPEGACSVLIRNAWPRNPNDVQVDAFSIWDDNFMLSDKKSDNAFRQPIYKSATQSTGLKFEFKLPMPPAPPPLSFKRPPSPSDVLAHLAPRLPPPSAPAAAPPPAEPAPAPASENTGRVWFATMWPDNLKPVLEEKKLLLTVVGLLPFGSVWGPIQLLGQGFDMDWALAPVLWSLVGVVFIAVPFAGWVFGWPVFLAMGWIATQTMFANLNRSDIKVGEDGAK